MKALSIRLPHAVDILTGFKKVENRTWRLPKTIHPPERIIVHVGKTVTPEERVALGDYYWDFEDMLGCLVGEVTITGCVTESNDPYFTGPYGFTLSDPKHYDRLIPCKGRLGFFEVTL